MKKIYVCLLSAIIALTVLSSACFALNLEETGDWNQLITSNYKDGFMTIDTDGDRIKISGVFKNDYPKNISIQILYSKIRGNTLPLTGHPFVMMYEKLAI